MRGSGQKEADSEKEKYDEYTREPENPRACFKYFISTCVGKAHRTRRRHPHCPAAVFFFLFLFGIVNKTRDVWKRRPGRGAPIERNLAKEGRTASWSPFMSILFHSGHGYGLRQRRYPTVLRAADDHAVS